jgi:hypothetical protein
MYTKYTLNSFPALYIYKQYKFQELHSFEGNSISPKIVAYFYILAYYIYSNDEFITVHVKKKFLLPLEIG